MTEQSPPMRRPIPAALAVARRAMVVAAAAMVIAALAVVVALLGEPESDSAEAAALERAQEDAAAAQEESDAATAMADAAIVIAEEAAAKAEAVETALADALASAGETVDPEIIAQLEAQLEEARNLAATALVAAGGAGASDTSDTPGAATGDETASGEAPEPDEEIPAAEEEDASAADDEPAAEEEPAPEPDDTDAAAALPGEPSEFGPSAGTGLAVVGIRHDSALNFRDAPNGAIIARLDNVMDGVRDPAVYVRRPSSDDIIDTVDLHNGVVATGNTRQLPTTIWHELQVGSLLGWSSSTFLAPLGAPRDAIDEVVEGLGGTPAADTLSELGRRVAALFASTGEVQSRTTVSSRPGVFEALGDITLDVLGLPDDAVRGYRVHITADSGAEASTQGDGGPFTLRSVTVTPICDSHRGVSDDGACN
jgi:hypothetical protein